MNTGMKSEGLSAIDRALLDFADQRWNYAGNQADAIQHEFGMSVTRFWQRVNRLLDDPAAVEYAPQLVYRLRRLRTPRSRIV